MESEKKINYFTAIICAIIAIIIFCAIAVVFNVMSLDSLPINFLGATLGALIGALITLVLLRGQTDIEEKKGKDIRILKKKMKVFHAFIKDVWAVWSDQKITIEEFQNLTSKYYQNLMIYIKKEGKKEDRLKIIGDCLSIMGQCIGKNTGNDIKTLRTQIVTIINELSKELELGGEINEGIMDAHDKIVFPLLFRNALLVKLNEELVAENSSSIFKEGKYELIWEGANHEFITFELKEFAGIKLTIGSEKDKLKMVFMADPKFHKIDKHRHTGGNGRYHKRFGEQFTVSDPIPDDEDKKPTPLLDFSKEESMKVFREEKRGFENVLVKRVQYYLSQWRIDNLDIIEFLKENYG